MRFSNDRLGFEEAFDHYCARRGGAGAVDWLHRKCRGVAERWARLADWIAGGRAKRALALAGKFAEEGWIYLAPNDVWRFDTGGGKRILGIAGEVGKEARAVVLSVAEKGEGPVAFRHVVRNVGVLRAESGDWHTVGKIMEGAKGWIFVNPLQYTGWLEERKSTLDKRVVYDAHDVFVDGFKARGFGEAELEESERRLLKDAERVWFCTEADREATRRRYRELDGNNWGILPNGIHAKEVGGAVVPSVARKKRASVGWMRPVVLFAGANYGPNYEAVDEISRVWAPKHAEVTFVVLGMRLDRYLRDGGVPPAENVVFTGLVSEEEKRALYDLSDVAIVPVKTGTGSSLKVPEAIARGKIVIGTRVGLRGFEEWTKWESVVLSERGEDELGRVLGRLDEVPGAYDASCRMAAEEMQRRYTWGVLMERWRGTWGGKTHRNGTICSF